jgi:hypothetical protein
MSGNLTMKIKKETEVPKEECMHTYIGGTKCCAKAKSNTNNIKTTRIEDAKGGKLIQCNSQKSIIFSSAGRPSFIWRRTDFYIPKPCMKRLFHNVLC